MRFGDTYIWFGDPRVKLASVWFGLGVLAGALLVLAACGPEQVVPESCAKHTSVETGRLLPVT